MAFLGKNFTPGQRGSGPKNQPVLEQWVRVSRSAASLPQTAAAAIFNVLGGRVIVKMLLGEVTTAIQNQVCNTKVTVNPTAGTSGDVAANLDIANDEVGTFYMVEGDGTALVGTNAGTSFAAGGFQYWVAPVGTIDLETAASNTGAIKWDLFYIPLDPGAYVTAA